GGPSLTALDWSVYDRWLRGRALVPDAPRLVIVTRDAASEARFGTGVWDRAVIAQAVAALGRAGAAVVGLDVPLGQPSAPGRGGATSDALLAQAMHGVDVVSVTPAGLPSTPSSARSDEKIGHAVAEPDPDGVVRAVPLWLRSDDRTVPAFGLALIGELTRAPAAQIRVPVDSRGRALVSFTARTLPPALAALSC